MAVQIKNLVVSPHGFRGSQPSSVVGGKGESCESQKKKRKRCRIDDYAPGRSVGLVRRAVWTCGLATCESCGLKSRGSSTVTPPFWVNGKRHLRIALTTHRRTRRLLSWLSVTLVLPTWPQCVILKRTSMEPSSLGVRLSWDS
jgi:hypothetical protein